MMGNKLRDQKVNNIRALAILIVVIGHSIIIFDPEWGIYHPQYSSSLLMYIKHYISIIQMPLFFSLSGYCYFLSPWWGKESFIKFVVKKTKRLILPFAIVGLFWVLPIRLASNYPFWQGLSIWQIIARLFIGMDTGHLWYLGALFLIFVLAGLWRITSEKLFCGMDSKAVNGLLLIAILVLSLGSSILPEEFFIRSCAKYLFWFYLGSQIRKRHSLNYQGEIRWIFFIVACVLISLSVFFTFPNKFVYKMTEYLGTSLFVIACYWLIPDKELSFCSKLSQDSFGIYLFHSPMLYPVFNFLNWLQPLTIVLFNVIICGSLSVLITHLLRRNEWTKRVLGE